MIHEGPLSFDHNLVLVKPMERELQVSKIKFTEVAFWIRLYDIPLNAMNEKVRKLVGKRIGSVVNVDGTWGEYMKVRVKLNISLPLMRGTHVDLGPLGVFWIRFAYERLPKFCYFCGKLGHQQKDCKAEGILSMQDGNLPLGSWLRAGTPMVDNQKFSSRTDTSDRNSSLSLS